MSAGSASVDARSSVSLWEFDEEDVLNYAAEVIRDYKAKLAANPDKDRGKTGQVMDEAIAKVADAVGIQIGDMPPASTAATITSMDALRAYCGREAPAGITDLMRGQP